MTEQLGSHDHLFDILRGVAALTGNRVVARMAATVARHRRADLAIAFNHKQIGSKLWVADTLAQILPGPLGGVWILGGWHGMLAAILQDDLRLDCGIVTSIDLDPGCAPVAETLNAPALAEGRFKATTGDMLALDYANAPGLIINTSCEHLADVRGWRARLRPGQLALMQSNNYFREPDHVSCVADLEAFKVQAGLGEVLFAGERETRNYTRFMLIGRA